MSEIVITQGYNGATISANSGDTLTIQLPENPTTGYRWTMVAANTDVLLLTGGDFQLGAQAGVGGGGLRVFRFFAKSRGSTQVQGSLMRSWESGSPRDTISIWVNVR